VYDRIRFWTTWRDFDTQVMNRWRFILADSWRLGRHIPHRCSLGHAMKGLAEMRWNFLNWVFTCGVEQLVLSFF